MRLITTLSVAAVLAAGPSLLAAQDTTDHAGHGMHMHGMRGRAGGPGRMDPFGGLLERRAELGLTGEQVSRIEAIRNRVQAQNRPLLERLSAARRQAGLPEPGVGARDAQRTPPTEAQREARRRFREANRPLLDQIHDNARSAMREVHEVLTPQQREHLREAHRGQGQRHGRRGHFQRG
jgi:Spy/CpxP family protein refolding chaperone